jgi:hypothetical protein
MAAIQSSETLKEIKRLVPAIFPTGMINTVDISRLQHQCSISPAIGTLISFTLRRGDSTPAGFFHAEIV